MRKSSAFILFTFLPRLLIAQDIEIFEHRAVVNSQYTNGENVTVRANKSITLAPGFKFDPTGSNTLSADIEHIELAIGEEESLLGGPPGELGQLVGTDGVAGAIPGSFTVSPGGAATYTIPIECPPGINGMTPQIALAYNSQSGNGIAGWGWNLSGISAITRVPKNLYYDGEVESIKWDATDAFAMNGVRLIEIENNYTSREYRLENDPTVKITAYEWTSDGPGWFTVLTRDGTEHTYGKNWNSSFSFQYASRSTPLIWSITQSTDTYDNSISYTYRVDSTNGRYSNFLLDKIEYTERDNQQPFYEINVLYESRTDSLISWTNKQAFKIGKRIDRVSVKYNSTTYRTYDLDYGWINYSILQFISLEGEDSEMYNSTAFDYGDGTITTYDSSFNEASAIETTHLKQITSGDFDGNGIQDLCVKTQLDLGFGYVENYYTIYLREELGGQIITTPINSSIIVETHPEAPRSDMLIGDYNGDGADDIAIPRLFLFEEDPDVWALSYRFFSIIIDGSNWDTIEIFDDNPIVFEYSGASFDGDEPPFYSAAELNGDGIKDLFILNTNYTIPYSATHNIHLWLSKPGTPQGYEIKEFCLSNIYGEESEDFRLGDYNNDGLADIIGNYGSVKAVFLNTGSGNHFNYQAEITNIDESDRLIAEGDFNRDGQLDYIIVDEEDDTYLAVCQYNSYSYSMVNLNYEWTNKKDLELDRCFVVDVNHDLLPDIILADEVGKTLQNDYDKTIWRTYLNNGSSLVHDSGEDKENTERSKRFLYADMTADGVIDQIKYEDVPNQDLDRFNLTDMEYSDGNPLLIDTITNGLGNSVNIQYNSLAEVNIVYHRDDFSFPLRSFASSFIKVVSSCTDGLNTYDYTYNGASVRLEGKGFTGFKKISVHHDLSDTKTVTETALNTDYCTPDTIVKKIYFDENELLNSTLQTYYTQSLAAGEKRYNLRLLEQESTDYLNEVFQRVTPDDYDSYNMPVITTTETYRSGNSTPVLTKIDSVKYLHRETAWQIGLVERQVSKLTRGTETQRTVKDFSYNSNGKPSTIYLHPGEDFEIKTEFIYNSFGSLLSKTTSALNDPNIPTAKRSRTVSCTYSSNGRFLESKTNSTGFETSYTYDPVSGRLLTSTDEDNSLTSTISYDGFGRKLKTVSPEGLESINTFHWATNHTDAPAQALTYSLEQVSGLPDTYVFTDKYGRVLRTVTLGFNGDKIYTDKLYNSNGQLWKTSLPYEPGETIYYSEYFYDDYGREIKIEFPDGRKELTTYIKTNYIGIKKEIVATDNSRQESKHYVNSLGETILSYDSEGQTVETLYYPSGLPKEYAYGSGNAVALEYDINGNRTSITDPNAGTVLTKYNAFGELIEQEDALGNLTKFEYDLSGRITKEEQFLYDDLVNAENTKTYSYDSDFIGNLDRVSQDNRADSITYDYDSYGRIVTETEVFYVDEAETQSKTITFESSYDDLGRLSSRTYPGNFEVNYSYSVQGDLKAIETEDQLLWECRHVSNPGQITAYMQGDYYSTNNYDDFGVLQSQNLSGLKHFDYLFDDFGNLTSRKDYTNNLEEEFEYDGMNRLTEIEYYENNVHQSSCDVSMTYAQNGYGNMSSKSDVGDFTYGETMDYNSTSYTSGPHALTSIDNLEGYFPNDQEITYTQFNKVQSITEYIDESDEISLDIAYGTDNRRRQSEYADTRNANAAYTKFYFGDYEEKHSGGEVTKYYFIHSPAGLCAIYTIDSESNDSILWHVFTDHLGSPSVLIDADSAENKLEYSFTSWGIPRDPTDWSQAATTSLLADRGFTGHEHLSEYGLINMNGRVYDPVIGRFLSPDPYIQMPGMRSGFNRYSYCFNNPLVYTDPDGELAWFVPIIIGAAIGFEAGGWISSGTAAFWKWQGDDWKAAGVGAMIGAAAGAVTAAAIGPAGGITGMTTQVGTTTIATKGWGITSTSLLNANLNMVGSGIHIGGDQLFDWDISTTFNSGLVGLASGIWAGTGGFGLAKGNILEKTLFENVGLAGRSIGNNWARGDDLFSRVNLGVGPLQFSVGKDVNGLGESLFNVNNLFQVAGLTNAIVDKNATVSWNRKNLSLTYHGGRINDAINAYWGGTGAYFPVGNSANDSYMLTHEMRHVWQSRAMGNSFLPNYFGSFLFQVALGNKYNYYTNFFETLAEGFYGY